MAGPGSPVRSAVGRSPRPGSPASSAGRRISVPVASPPRRVEAVRVGTPPDVPLEGEIIGGPRASSSWRGNALEAVTNLPRGRKMTMKGRPQSFGERPGLATQTLTLGLLVGTLAAGVRTVRSEDRGSTAAATPVLEGPLRPAA